MIVQHVPEPDQILTRLCGILELAPARLSCPVLASINFKAFWGAGARQNGAIATAAAAAAAAADVVSFSPEARVAIEELLHEYSASIDDILVLSWPVEVCKKCRDLLTNRYWSLSPLSP